MTREAREIMERIAVRIVQADMQNIYEDFTHIWDEVAKVSDSDLIQFIEDNEEYA